MFIVGDWLERVVPKMIFVDWDIKTLLTHSVMSNKSEKNCVHTFTSCSLDPSIQNSNISYIILDNLNLHRPYEVSATLHVTVFHIHIFV